MADDQTKDTIDFLSKYNPSESAVSDDQTKDTLAFLKGQPEDKGSNILRRAVVDPAVGLARGLLVGVPEAVTGIADIPTLGYAGKAYEAVTKGLGLGGFKEQHEAFNRLTTPETMEAQRKVAEAKGFVDTTITALQNPSAIAQTVAQSIPPMLAGGRALSAVASRFGLGAASASVGARTAERLLEGAALTAEAKAPMSFMTGMFPKEAFASAGKVLGEGKIGRAAARAGMAGEAATRDGFSNMVKSALGTVEPEQAARFLREGAKEAAKIAGKQELARFATIGGIAEGLITAGQNVSQIRQEEPTGTITAKQAAIGAMSGALTGVIGVLGGRLAAKLGFADFDTLAAGAKLAQQGGKQLGTKELGIFKRLIYGAIQEGIFEELPQSMQEQLAQNIAQGKPITDNVVEQGAMGMLAGFAQSMGVNVASHVYDRATTKLDPTTKKIDQDIAELNQSFKGMMDVPMYGNDIMTKVGILPTRQPWWSYEATPPTTPPPTPPTAPATTPTPAGPAPSGVGMTPASQGVMERQKKLSEDALVQLKNREEDVPESIEEPVKRPKNAVDLNDPAVKEEMVTSLRNFGYKAKEAAQRVGSVFAEIGDTPVTKENLLTSVIAGKYVPPKPKQAELKGKIGEPVPAGGRTEKVVVKPQAPPKPQDQLRAALRFDNGEVHIAKESETTHPQIYERLENEKNPFVVSEGKWGIENGWVDKDGKFYTREDVAKRGGSPDTYGSGVTYIPKETKPEIKAETVEEKPPVNERIAKADEAAIQAAGRSEALRNVKKRQARFVENLDKQELGSTFTIAEGEHKGTWKKLKTTWKNTTTNKTYGGKNIVNKLFQHSDEIKKTIAKPQAKAPKAVVPKAPKAVGPQNLVTHIEKLGGIRMSKDLAGKTGAMRLIKGQGFVATGRTQVKEEGDLGKLVRKNGKVTLDELVSDLHETFPSPTGGKWTIDDLVDVLKSGKGREIVPVEVGYGTKVEKQANAKAIEDAEIQLAKERWMEEGYGREEEINTNDLVMGETVIYDGIRYTVGPTDSLGHILTDDNGEDITLPFNSPVTVQLEKKDLPEGEVPFARVTRARPKRAPSNVLFFANKEAAEQWAKDMEYGGDEYTIEDSPNGGFDFTVLAPPTNTSGKRGRATLAFANFVDSASTYIIKAYPNSNMPIVGDADEYEIIVPAHDIIDGTKIRIITRNPDGTMHASADGDLEEIWSDLLRKEQVDLWNQLVSQRPYGKYDDIKKRTVLETKDEFVPETLRDNEFFESNEKWQTKHLEKRAEAEKQAKAMVAGDKRSLQTIQSERLAKENPLKRDENGVIEITTGASYDVEEKLARDYEDLKNQNPQKTTVDEWFQNIKDTIGDYTKDYGKAPPKNTKVDVVRDENSGESYITFQDFGIGISPEVIFQHLIKVGGRGTKSGEHSGSHGIGKVVFFSYPERWSVVSISKDINSPTGYTETVMQSTGLGFMSGNKDRVKIKAKPTTNTETGTTFNIKSKAYDALKFSEAVKSYVNGFGGELAVDFTNRIITGDEVTKEDKATLESNPISKRPTKWDSDHLDLGANKIDIHYFLKPNANQSFIDTLLSLVEGLNGLVSWQVLNKDNPVNIDSWVMNFKTAKKPDFKIVINFTQTPDNDKDPNYPFFNNRTKLLDSVRKEIVKTIEARIDGENREVNRIKKEEFQKALDNVGQIEGVDVFVPFIDKESIESISNSVAIHGDMVKAFASLFSHFNELTQRMETLLEMGKPAKLGLAMLPVEKTSSGYKKSWVFGFMPFEELGYDGLFISPWSMLDYFNENDFFDKMETATGQSRAETFAEKMFNTMMHEWVHVKETGHGADFVNKQAQAQMLAKAWENLSASLGKSGMQSLLQEAKGIYETYKRDIEELSADIENASASGTVLRLFNGSDSKIGRQERVVRRGNFARIEANRERLSRAKRLEGGGKEVRIGDVQETLPGIEETFELTDETGVYKGKIEPKKQPPKQEDLFGVKNAFWPAPRALPWEKSSQPYTMPVVVNMLEELPQEVVDQLKKSKQPGAKETLQRYRPIDAKYKDQAGPGKHYKVIDVVGGNRLYSWRTKEDAEKLAKQWFDKMKAREKSSGTKEEAASEVRKSGYDFVPALRVAGKVYTAYLGDMKPSNKKYHDPIWGSIPTSVLLAAGEDIQVGYVDKNGEFHERLPEKDGIKIKKISVAKRNEIQKSIQSLLKANNLIDKYKELVGSGKATSKYGSIATQALLEADKKGKKEYTYFVQSEAAEVSFEQVAKLYEDTYGKEFPYRFLEPLLQKAKTKLYLDPYHTTDTNGFYVPVINEIHIGRFWEGNVIDSIFGDQKGIHEWYATVVAHESIHAILDNLETINPEEYQNLKEKLNDFLHNSLYPAAMDIPDGKLKDYIFFVLGTFTEGGYSEAVTYALTNPVFARWMDTVEVPQAENRKSETLWSKFKHIIRETIRNIFGVENIDGRTLLDEFNDILDTSLMDNIHEIPQIVTQEKENKIWEDIKSRVKNPEDVGMPLEILHAKNVKFGQQTDFLGLMKKLKFLSDNTKSTSTMYRTPTPTTSLRSEIDNYLGEMQITEWRMTNLAKQINKELPKPRQHAIARWMRANGDTDLLKEWASKYTADPSYKAALTLTAKEKEWAEFFKKSIVEDANNAVKSGLTRSFAINYLKGEQLFSDTIRQKMQAIVESPLMNSDPEKALKMMMKELERSPKNIGASFIASRRALLNAMSLKALITNLTKTKEADGRNSLVIGRAGSPVSNEEKEQLLKTDPQYLTEANYHKQGRSTRDYKVFDNPAMRGHIYADKDEEGNMNFFRGDIVVHPDALKRINALLGKSLIREWAFPKRIPFIGGLKPGAIALKIGAFAKGTMLGMSPFHLVHTGSHSVFHGVNPFNLKEIDFDKRPLLVAGVKHGLLLVDRHAMNVFSEGLAAGGLWNVLPTKAGRWVGETHEQFTKFTFENMIPRMKADVFEKTVASMEKAYAKDLASGKMTRDQLLYEAAATANNAFGGQNYKSMGRNPTFIDAMRLFLLAPDFLESRLKFFIQGMTPEGRESRIALFKSALYMSIIAQMGNMLIGDDKRLHLDKPFSIIAGGREWTPRSVAGDMIHLITDWRNFAYNRLNPVFGKPGAEVATGRDRLGRKIEPEDIVKDTFKGLVPIPFQGTIRDPGVRWMESVRNTVFQSVGLSNYPYRTPFDRQVQEAFQKRIVISSPPEERKRLTEIRKFGDEIKRLREEGKPIDKVMMEMHKAVQDKKIYKEDVQTAYKRAKQNTTAVEMKSLQAEDLAKIWKYTNDQEKAQYRDIRKTKLSNLRDRHPERYKKLKAEYPELWA